jgi:hypothetical protein
LKYKVPVFEGKDAEIGMKKGFCQGTAQSCELSDDNLVINGELQTLE